MSSEWAVVNGGGDMVHYVEAPRLVARIEDVKQAMLAVRTLHRDVLRKDIDFGVIPGTGNKPCLLKPGAESLLMAFQLGVGTPEIEHVPLDAPTPGHIEYRVKLPIIYRATGQVIGYGVASCSTMEKKYRYRNGERVCPKCGKPTIIQGKAEYGGGWLCFAKKGGCGAKFADSAPEIIAQSIGQVENPDPADQYNTCLKMAKKRALIDGALTCCAASGTFTQDVEERLDDGGYVDPPLHVDPVNVSASADIADNRASQPPAYWVVDAVNHIAPTATKGGMTAMLAHQQDDKEQTKYVVQLPPREGVQAGETVGIVTQDNGTRVWQGTKYPARKGFWASEGEQDADLNETIKAEYAYK